MKRTQKLIFGLCIAAIFSACETYDEEYHHGTHRHAYYYDRGDHPYTYYGYERRPYVESRSDFGSDFPYSERAYVRPGGVRVYRY